MLSATFKIVQKARSSERSHSAARNCARILDRGFERSRGREGDVGGM